MTQNLTKYTSLTFQIKKNKKIAIVMKVNKKNQNHIVKVRGPHHTATKLSFNSLTPNNNKICFTW